MKKLVLYISLLLNVVLIVFLVLPSKKMNSVDYIYVKRQNMKDGWNLSYSEVDSLLGVLRVRDDTAAYDKLFMYYLKERVPGEMLHLNLIMANRWHHAYSGMFNVYLELLWLNDFSHDRGNIEDIDHKTLKLALSYLLDSYENERDSVLREHILYDVKYFQKEGYIIDQNGRFKLNDAKFEFTQKSN